MDFLIHKVLFIYGTWFLDVRISTQLFLLASFPFGRFFASICNVFAPLVIGCVC